MRPQLKRVHSPDVEEVDSYAPSDPGRFGILIQLMVGPVGQDGEESFDVVLCAPRWLAEQVGETGVLDLRHHLLVNEWDWGRVLDCIERFLASVEAPSWSEVAAIVGRIGRWEYEDYDDGRTSSPRCEGVTRRRLPYWWPSRSDTLCLQQWVSLRRPISTVGARPTNVNMC